MANTMVSIFSTFTIFLCLFVPIKSQTFLEVSGTNIIYNGEKVFLSGMNIAWHQFGYDFGNGRYECCSKTQLEDYIDRIADAGGNSLRIWIHTDGRDTPAFDGDGYITGSDSQGTMVNDLSLFLDKARSRNILVFPVLWNGATTLTQSLKDLLWDEAKLQSYIDNALIPLVRGLKDKVALGGWEIMNEAEGIVQIGQSNSNPCFDTTPLQTSGAGWTNENIPMQNILKFHNMQIAAIKQEDPKALATAGSWSERSQTDEFGFRNYYTDVCLRTGGDNLGTVDILQMHTYAWEGSFSDSSPMNNPNSRYNIDKPNVIGEFSQSGGDGSSIVSYFDWLYNEGYNGAWSWQANGGGHHADPFETQALGLNHLRDRNDQGRGGRVNIVLEG